MGMGGREIADDLMSFSGRIRDAMTRRGWPTHRDGKDIAVVVLRTRWKEFFKGRPEIKIPSRPTFYDWLASREPKISIRNLYLLSDLLNVNARWLSIKEGSIAKPIFPTDEIQPLIDAWNNLSSEARDELIKEANRFLRIQGTTSPAYPFHPSKK